MARAKQQAAAGTITKAKQGILRSYLGTIGQYARLLARRAPTYVTGDGGAFAAKCEELSRDAEAIRSELMAMTTVVPRSTALSQRARGGRSRPRSKRRR